MRLFTLLKKLSLLRSLILIFYCCENLKEDGLWLANSVFVTPRVISYSQCLTDSVNPLNAELNPICYLLALLGAHHFLHVSRIRDKLLTFRLLMSYIYGAPILDVSRSHTTTQHSR